MGKIIMLCLLLLHCNVTTNKLQHKNNMLHYTNSDSSVVNMFLSYEVEQLEKSFPCTVETVIKQGYITECGIFFESKQLFTVGDTLKNFNSIKHK